VHIGEKVLERLATSDKTTIVVERQPDGKMRITSGSWDGEKIFLKDQVLVVRHAVPGARLHVARKTKAPDEWVPPVPVYDPYGPGTSSDEFIDDWCDAVTGVVVARSCSHRARKKYGLVPRQLLVSRSQLDALEARGYLDPDLQRIAPWPKSRAPSPPSANHWGS
jgi:hypothetical protein